MSFTIIDIETTGLSKFYHKITEIAAAKIAKGKIIEEYQTLVNPETRIPRFITRLTGIDNEMVKNAPKINKVLPSFIEFLGQDIFVAHNVTFDYGFIEQNLKRYHDYNIKNEKLCTRKLANRMHPEMPSKRLADLCQKYSIQNEQAHRALGDVRATAEIFSKMKTKLEEKGIKENEITKFEKLPLACCHKIFTESD